jgi:energy-coupling factor transporter ATP-binding protein EcfA2
MIGGASNPFATRWTRPGQIPFQFPEPANLTQVLDRLHGNGWRGAVVGPHGSGKSTLLATMLPSLLARGLRVHGVRLRDRQRNLAAADWSAIKKLGREHTPGLVIVDGYEQLSRWNRRWLQWRTRRASLGLLVTCHHAMDLPVIWESSVCIRTIQALVRRLSGCVGTAPPPEFLTERLQWHRGNAREVLFDCYDWFQSHHRVETTSPPREIESRPGAIT